MYPPMRFSIQFLISTNVILTFVGNNFIFFYIEKYFYPVHNEAQPPYLIYTRIIENS